ncbi:MAG: hypothetical protein WB762_21245 [Candidatus Sulfotelmatobacter sp.]
MIEKVETEVDKETARVFEPKIPAPLRPKQRTLLEEIFAGHQDFPGYTPDRKTEPEL